VPYQSDPLKIADPNLTLEHFIKKEGFSLKTRHSDRAHVHLKLSVCRYISNQTVSDNCCRKRFCAETKLTGHFSLCFKFLTYLSCTSVVLNISSTAEILSMV